MSRVLHPDTAVVSPYFYKDWGCCQFLVACHTLRRFDAACAGRPFRPIMTEMTQNDPQSGATEIPEELALEIRKLAHDLSNALEIIVQTSYLLGTVELKEPGKEWLRMLDNGVSKALDINLALRNYVKAHTPR